MHTMKYYRTTDRTPALLLPESVDGTEFAQMPPDIQRRYGGKYPDTDPAKSIYLLDNFEGLEPVRVEDVSASARTSARTSVVDEVFEAHRAGRIGGQRPETPTLR